MKRRLRVITVGILLSATAVVAILLSGAVPLDFAASENQGDGEVDVRVQARQTQAGRIEVRAQSSVAVDKWMTHTPGARLLPADAEPGRWYSSSTFTVSLPAPAPDISDPAGYTQWFVNEAIRRYERDGLAETVEYYNSAESWEGQWYVFIIDEDGVTIANRNPDLLGLHNDDINGPDGYPAGRVVVAAASADGAWVDYQFNNPATGQAEIKHSWVVRRDGLIFGSGWYEDAPSKIYAPGAFTQSYVERALELYRVLGRDATFEYYNSPQSIDGQWYLFIHSVDGTRLVNGARADRPGWLGSNLHGTGVDVTGYDYTADTLAIETSGWISYVFPNPDAELSYQRKHSWLVRHDDLLFGSGWYDRNYDLAEQDPAAYARALVQDAIDRYDADGREAVIEYHNSPESVDGEWYVSIYELDGTRLAHPFLPLGENLLDGGPDVTGRHFRADIIAIEDRGWVSYVFVNPESGEQEQKHTWIVRHEGLIFASGWYEEGAYKAPDS
ncbi:MAG: cache domain-containing protein [Chloroflexota bacterium]|nr:cache domain-containing protein [Chloroflexota bacterium]